MNFSLRRLLTVGAGGGIASYLFVINSHKRPRSLLAADLSTSHEELPDVRNLNLKSVQVFFRHGARTPLKHVPGLEEVTYDKHTLIKPVPHTEIPYEVEYLHGGSAPPSRLETIYAKTVFKGGVVAGMLTVVGKDQAYQLGQRLAKRYREEHNFISKDFMSHEIFTRSTNIQRCIDSLQCVIAGMFGTDSFRNRSPVVIRVEKAEDEILYPNYFGCPTFRMLSKYARQQYVNTATYADLVKRIQAYTGDSRPAEEFDMMQLRDHIVARKTHGLTVPEFLETMRDQVDQAAVNILVHHICGYVSVFDKKSAESDAPVLPKFHGVQLNIHKAGVTLGMGQAWNMILDVMENCIDQHANSRRVPKMYLYSCHDSSLVPLLIGLGCFDNKWPPYTADVTFELYEDAKRRHWVKVSYCGKDMIPVGCSKPLIPFERFHSIVKEYAVKPSEFRTLCDDVGRESADVPPAKFD